MGRKKKFENALIVKDIMARECGYLGDMKGSLMFRFLDLKKNEDREFLQKQIEDFMKIFSDASKELKEAEKRKDKKDEKI